jgi:DNA (cytosine-5)-methyltransferase 1
MKVLDLFSGIGGFSLGLERAGMETVAFCEFEPHAQAVLRKHWPEIPIFDDVRELDGKQFRGTVDVVCGGSPCQDFSQAGTQEGVNGERSGLYREMLRIISECRPKYWIFENVPGLLTGEQGRWFGQFLYDLAKIGYDAEWHCVSASYIGAPHQRDRIWVIAYPNLQRCQGVAKIAHHLKQQVELMRSAAPFRRLPDLPEPRTCGSNDGIPRLLDRLKRLGNAVVPQIPEAIGRAIMDYENE